jgi:ComF family protein
MPSTLQNFFTHLLDVLFPRVCVGCRAPDTLLCGSCINSIRPASKTEQPFIRAVFDYKNPLIKRSIWRFKYENARGYAETFAPYLYDEILGTLGDSLSFSVSEKFLLVPVPLHSKRLRERGYNQSALLAREILKLDQAEMFEYAPEILVRRLKTNPQARNEKRAARFANLRDAFIVVDPARIRGRIIILIDDVTTTGATLLEAKRSFASSRPRKILAFTVGH